jgi:hypothetical protein
MVYERQDLISLWPSKDPLLDVNGAGPPALPTILCPSASTVKRRFVDDQALTISRDPNGIRTRVDSARFFTDDHKKLAKALFIWNG